MTLVTSKKCAQCAGAFRPRRADQRYCDSHCRRKAKHQRAKVQSIPASNPVSREERAFRCLDKKLEQIVDLIVEDHTIPRDAAERVIVALMEPIGVVMGWLAEEKI